MEPLHTYCRTCDDNNVPNGASYCPVCGAANPHSTRHVMPAADARQTIWSCKIGEVSRARLPRSPDLPMRDAISKAYEEITGKEPDFIFSGWGASLTKNERAVVEDGELDLDDEVATSPQAEPHGGDEPCAACGEPKREHSHNGACYGKCGKFVTTPPPASPGEDEQSLGVVKPNSVTPCVLISKVEHQRLLALAAANERLEKELTLAWDTGVAAHDQWIKHKDEANALRSTVTALEAERDEWRAKALTENRYRDALEKERERLRRGLADFIHEVSIGATDCEDWLTGALNRARAILDATSPDLEKK